jgi:hypothetical protein
MGAYYTMARKAKFTVATQSQVRADRDPLEPMVLHYFVITHL